MTMAWQSVRPNPPSQAHTPLLNNDGLCMSNNDGTATQPVATTITRPHARTSNDNNTSRQPAWLHTTHASVDDDVTQWSCVHCDDDTATHTPRRCTRRAPGPCRRCSCRACVAVWAV